MNTIHIHMYSISQIYHIENLIWILNWTWVSQVQLLPTFGCFRKGITVQYLCQNKHINSFCCDDRKCDELTSKKCSDTLEIFTRQQMGDSLMMAHIQLWNRCEELCLSARTQTWWCLISLCVKHEIDVYENMTLNMTVPLSHHCVLVVAVTDP